MSLTGDLDWLVPRSEWEKTKEHVLREWGEIDGRLGQHVDLAMREWTDSDRGAATEEIVDRIVRAGGARPRDADEKRKSAVDSLANEEDKVRAHCAVHTPTKEAFASFAKEHSDHYTGVELALALREYRQGGRYGRIEDKLERVSEDIEGLLRGASDTSGGATPQEQRTAAMIRWLSEGDRYDVGSELLTQHDIHRAIAAVAPTIDESDQVTDYLDSTYRPTILERIGYEPTPENDRIYAPVEDAEEQRREEANATAAEQMDQLMTATIATDGGTPE